MSWNGFQSLDLSGVEADNFNPITQPGLYNFNCTDVELKTGPNKVNKRLILTLVDSVGGGTLKAGFNIVHQGSPQAQEIALRQLKSFLISGGHPNPDHPGDLETLKGLTPKAYVDYGKPYIDKETGQEKKNFEVKRFVLPGEGGEVASAPASNPSTSGASGGAVGSRHALDDEIPF